MERYDIAIIGTGPAGVSAALTAQVRKKNILLIGSKNLSDKIEKAHAVKNYPGLSNVSGREMQSAFLNQLKEMEISITEDKVSAVYAMGEYFSIQGNGSGYEALSVILAAGMSVVKPYPGELEYLGNGVSYCVTCDAAFYKEREAIVIASSEKEEKEAEFLAQTADKVYYIPLYEGGAEFDGQIEVIRQKPRSVERIGERMKLVTEEGTVEADGIFLLREQVAPSQLVPGLRVDENRVRVDRGMQTNIRGLFACGDITGTPYQYVKAAGEGNVAALSAVDYLASHFTAMPGCS